MPELPDLEAIQDFLLTELLGATITSVQTPQPIPIRVPTPAEFAATLTGSAFTGIQRRGKFLLLSLDNGHVLAVNPMLTGRFRYCPPRERMRAKTCFILDLDNGQQLRYFDNKLMGKIYLVSPGDLHSIPGWDKMGPEALAPEVTLELFQQRLRKHPGQVKNILVNSAFLAGIGNAYADEILYTAGIYPYRRRTSLSAQETAALYHAMHRVQEEATAIVGARMGEDIHIKIRDFLKVHGKGGQPCPQCGGIIAQITANQRLTNYCRRCQR